MPVGVGETRAQGAARHQECCRLVPGRARQQCLVVGVGRDVAVAGLGLAGVGGGRLAGAVLPAHGGWEAQSRGKGDHSCTTLLQGMTHLILIVWCLNLSDPELTLSAPTSQHLAQTC